MSENNNKGTAPPEMPTRARLLTIEIDSTTGEMMVTGAVVQDPIMTIGILEMAKATIISSASEQAAKSSILVARPRIRL